MKFKALILILIAGMSSPALSNETDSIFSDIDQSIRFREYSEAVNKLKELIQLEIPEAQYRMADLYRSGKGVKRNMKAAITLYEKAALSGLVEAQYTLASIFEKRGQFQNISKAKKWYQTAADQGYRKAIEKIDQLNSSAISSAKHEVDDEIIFSAVRNNDLKRVQTFIDQGIDLNLFDSNLRSTFMIALLSEHEEMSKMLIPLSHHLDQADLEKRKPIHIASGLGYIDIVQQLISKKVDINAQDSLGNTALMIATRHNDADMISLLLKNKAKHLIQNKKKQTAINLVQLQNNNKTTRVYNRFGIKTKKEAESFANLDVNTFKKSIASDSSLYKGWPLLNVASLLGEIEIAKILLTQNVDLSATDNEGNTALHRAASKGELEIAKLLISNGSLVNALNNKLESPLYLAAFSGKRKMIEYLLNKNADTSLIAKNKSNALSISILNKHPESAIALASSKLNPSFLHHATLLAIQNKMETLSLKLLARDNLVNAVDLDRRNSLWHCANTGQTKALNYLLKNKSPNLDALDINGYSALARAVNNGNAEVSRILIEHGASIDTLTQEKNTLLMLSIVSGNTEITKKLLGLKANVNAKNNSGDTALMLAAASKKDDIIKLLIQAGADIQTRNKDDLNAYEIALKAGHNDTATLIREHSGRLFKIFN